MSLAFFAIAVAAGLFVGGVAVRDYRQRRFLRRWNGHRCMACGYDLRATAGVCPECGTPVPERLDGTRLALAMRISPAPGGGGEVVDARPVFETLDGRQATLFCRYLNRSGVSAEQVLFVHKRYASLIAHRVRVGPADVDRAGELKASVLRTRS